MKQIVRHKHYWPCAVGCAYVSKKIKSICCQTKPYIPTVCHKIQMYNVERSPCLTVGRVPQYAIPGVAFYMLSHIGRSMHNLCSRGMSVNHLNTFIGCFFLDDMTSSSSSKCVSALYLNSPHAVHESKSLLSFQNNIQSLWHAGIFSYPRPLELRNFFASYVLIGKVSSQAGNN
jgi:hypothetical protein